MTSAECCQNSRGTTACQPDGRCCAPLGVNCNALAQCCTGVCDMDAWVCVACLGEGVSCDANRGACCSGLACAGEHNSRRCQPTA